jgi:hypothetical protein
MTLFLLSVYLLYLWVVSKWSFKHESFRSHVSWRSHDDDADPFTRYHDHDMHVVFHPRLTISFLIFTPFSTRFSMNVLLCKPAMFIDCLFLLKKVYVMSFYLSESLHCCRYVNRHALAVSKILKSTNSVSPIFLIKKPLSVVYNVNCWKYEIVCHEVSLKRENIMINASQKYRIIICTHSLLYKPLARYY